MASSAKPANLHSVPTGHLRCLTCFAVFRSTNLLRRHLNTSKDAKHREWCSGVLAKACSNSADVVSPPATANPGNSAEAPSLYAFATPSLPQSTNGSSHVMTNAARPSGSSSQGVRNVLPAKIANSFERAGLANLLECPEAIQRIWDRVNCLPQLIAAQELYPTGKHYTEQDLFKVCLQAAWKNPRHLRIFVNGTDSAYPPEQKLDMLTTVAYQFHRTNSPERQVSIGAAIWLPNDCLFRVPRTAANYVAHHEEPLEAMWMVAGNVTDLHIGEHVHRKRNITISATNVPRSWQRGHFSSDS